jgi:hypothetical protein
LTKQTTESKVELDAGSFMKGMYLVKIVSGDKSYTQKVIKK